MKLLENPKFKQKSSPNKPLEQVLSALKFERGWSQDTRSQERVIASLGKLLDNRYILLREVTLEGLDIPIPLVLVGPTGVRVFFSCATRGVFRAKGDQWEQMDDRQQVYHSVSPNLPARTLLMSQAVGAFLSAREIQLPEVEPVLIFSDPGTHVESVRPVVRIVLVDGLERYLGSMLQNRAYLDKNDVQKIVDLLARSMGITDQTGSPFPEWDAFSFSDEMRKTSRLDSLEESIPRGEGVVKTLNKIPFSTRQWVLLGLLVTVNIIILVGLVLLILFTS